MSSTRPLSGLTVVEIGHSVAAPYAGMILGELGAEVIKVENPKGGDACRGWGPPFTDGTATAFHAFNRAKQQSVYLESLLGQYRTIQRSTRADNTAVGLPVLDQELDKLKAQLADLSSHYTDRHPDVRKIKEQIAKTERMKQQIAADLKSSAQDDSLANGTFGTAAGDAAEIREMSPMRELESQSKVNHLEVANRERAIQQLQAKIGE